jgi:hypothetical protein
MNDTQPDLMTASTAALARQLFTFLGGLLIARGVISEAQAPELIGAAMTVLSLAWSLIQKRNAHVALQDAIAAPAGLAKPEGFRS